MMGTRLVTNVDGYPLRLVLLFKYAYSYGQTWFQVIEMPINGLVQILLYFLFFRVVKSKIKFTCNALQEMHIEFPRAIF